MIFKNKCMLGGLSFCLGLFSQVVSAQVTQNVTTVSELETVLSDISSGSSSVDHINLEPNTYNLSNAISLTSAHDGITISGCDGVYVNGGVVLDAANFIDFNTVASPGFTLSDPLASSSIKVLDLAAQGLTVSDLGTINWHALNIEDFETPAVLWMDGEKMDLARWPNKTDVMTTDQMLMPGNWGDIRNEMDGQISYYEILATGTTNSVDDGMEFTVHSSLNSKVTSWNYHKTSASEKIWTDGVFQYTWEWEYNKVDAIDSNGAITLEHGSLSSFNIVTSGSTNPPVRNVSSSSNSKPSHFHFENVPEELDTAGEYFIDRDRMLLYFYPPTGWESKQLALSTLNETMISIDGASAITIENLTLQSGLKNGIEIENSSGITVENCVIRYFNQWGVRILGTDNTVDNCELYGLGGGGVSLGANVNSYSLVEENNQVLNSKIHSFAWDQKAQVPGVALYGVANKVIGNDISEGPHFGVKLRQSKACVVSDNRIHDLPEYHHFDGGAVYLGLGLNFQNRENRIDNNYLYNIPTNGIYLDNYTNGNFADGNVFYNVGNSTFTAASFAAIYNHGGGQNSYKDNIGVDCSVIIKTGSYIVKQGKAYRYMKSWMDAVATGAELEPGSSQATAYEAAFVDSDIANYIDMAANMPVVVQSTIASITTSNWPGYRDTWDAIGYDATVGNTNAAIGTELEAWKNYFALRYCASTIENNLGLYTDTAIYDAKNTKSALTSLGDNELFWEFSAYNNSHSNHMASANENYDVTTTASLFPALLANNAIDETTYATLSHGGGNLSNTITANLTTRGDVNATAFEQCPCNDLGLDYVKYNGFGECSFSQATYNATTNEYDIDLSAGALGRFINLSFLVNFDSQNGGMDPTETDLLADEDFIVLHADPDTEFKLISVQHNWVSDSNKYCEGGTPGQAWSWNRRVDVRIKYKGSNDHLVHNLKMDFNPNTAFVSSNGESYCSQTVNMDFQFIKTISSKESGKTSDEVLSALYPNPVKTNVHISNEAIIEKIEVLSLYGQKMTELRPNATTTQVDMSYLDAGMYLLVVYTENGKEVLNVVKQ